MKFFDRVKETATTTGTGNFTLLGAVTNFQTFLSTVSTGNQFSYTIDNNGEWEIGVGVISGTGNTLERVTVLDSSNTGALISFSSGTKNVFLINPAEVVDNFGDTNIIYNGNMDVWQENTSFGVTGSNVLTADGYRFVAVGAAGWTISRSTDVPTLAQSDCVSNYSMLADCVTADASMAAADYSVIGTYIEGYDVCQIAQQYFTLSFWVKATKTGIYGMRFRNSGLDRTYITEFTVFTSDVWEKKIIVVPPSPSAGTWDYTTGCGMEIIWTLAAGSDSFSPTVNSWFANGAGNYLTTSSQVVGSDSTNNNFRLAQVKIEPGQSPTKFIPDPFEKVLRKAQRYFESSYTYGTVVPTSGATVGPQYVISLVLANTVAIGQRYATYYYKVPKRITPTVTIYPYNTVTNTGRVSDNTPTDEAANTGGVQYSSTTRFVPYNNSGSTFTTGAFYIVYAFKADARI
jgi:hypothetical protein